MKKLLFILITFLPNSAMASGGNVLDNLQNILGEKCNDGNCGFTELIKVSNYLGEIFMIFTTTAATIMFVYAGFLYITSQGDSGKVKQATTIFRNVAVGFVIILASYLLVKELLTKLGLTNLANLIS